MKLQLRLAFSSSKMQTFNAFDLRQRLSGHILCCINTIRRNLSSTTQPIPKSVSRKFSSIKMNDNKSVIITAVLIGLVICIGTGVVFLTPPSDLECPIDGLTTLNGIVMEDIVPMTRFTVLEPKMAEYYDWTGRKVTTFTGMREARSRMAIHMHPFGGQSCVMSGSPATVFLEGTNETTEYPAGTCYYMPPGVYMTAANLGDEDQFLVDVLRGDPHTVVVCEEG